MRENRETSVLVCLCCHFSFRYSVMQDSWYISGVSGLTISRQDRARCHSLSDRVDAFSHGNLFQEIKFEKSRDDAISNLLVLEFFERSSSRFCYFYFSFAIKRISRSLDLSFSAHRARRRKTEESRQIVAKRAATNDFSFFGLLFLDPKNGKLLLLFFSLYSFFSKFTQLLRCMTNRMPGPPDPNRRNWASRFLISLAVD